MQLYMQLLFFKKNYISNMLLIIMLSFHIHQIILRFCSTNIYASSRYFEGQFLQFCSALPIVRFSAEAEERMHFISCCQNDGILEVLPYHECDPLSRDEPDYLSSMIRLQVQNISSRYSVFVTGKLLLLKCIPSTFNISVFQCLFHTQCKHFMFFFSSQTKLWIVHLERMGF